jgi:hypothetical protein
VLDTVCLIYAGIAALRKMSRIGEKRKTREKHRGDIKR